MNIRHATGLLLLLFGTVSAATVEDYAGEVSQLADPLNQRESAEVRLYKVIYWLAVAKQNKTDVTNVLELALARVMTNQWAGKPEIITNQWASHPADTPPRGRGGPRGTRGSEGGLVGRFFTNDAPVRRFTQECLLRGLQAIERYGCVDEKSLKQLRQGLPPVIPREADAGIQLVARAIVPTTYCPELTNALANFELTASPRPESLVRKMGEKSRRQIYADKFLALGVLSQQSYDRLFNGP